MGRQPLDDDSGNLSFSLLPLKQLGGYLRGLRYGRNRVSPDVGQTFAYLVGMQSNPESGDPLGQPLLVAVDASGRVLTSTPAGSSTVQLADGTTPAQLAAVSAAGAVKVDGSAVTQPISGNVGQANATPVTGGFTANGQTVTATGLGPYNALQLLIAGTYSTGATIQFEVSPDGGTNWVSVAAVRTDNSLPATAASPAANATLAYDVYIGGATAFRGRVSAWAAPTGTINFTINPLAEGSDPWAYSSIVGPTGVLATVAQAADATSATLAGLVVQTLGGGFNGTAWDRLRTLSAAGAGLGVQLLAHIPPTSQSQSQTNLDNAITIGATAAQKNRLMQLSGSVRGSGVMPTVAAPLVVTVKDGGTTILSYALVAGGPFSVPAPSGGWVGTTNTAMTVDIPIGGANVTTDLNVSYVVA